MYLLNIILNIFLKAIGKKERIRQPKSQSDGILSLSFSKTVTYPKLNMNTDDFIIHEQLRMIFTIISLHF